MTMREIDRLKTIQAVVDGNLRAQAGAIRLQLSRRQVDRLVQRYLLEGPAGLVSRKRGQRHRQLAPGLASTALSIIRDRYADFGPTLACEKLHASVAPTHQLLMIASVIDTDLTCNEVLFDICQRIAAVKSLS